MQTLYETDNRFPNSTHCLVAFTTHRQRHEHGFSNPSFLLGSTALFIKIDYETLAMIYKFENKYYDVRMLE